MKDIKSIYIGLVGLLMTACQTEQWEASQGSLCITLAEDVSISTKSTPAELGKPTAEKFTLNIVKESTGESLYSGVYTSQPIPASTGTYTVTATYGTDLAIALNSPYYKGEETGVEVEVNQSTPVTLTCKVANALASVAYGEGQKDKFDELFSTYGVEVKVGNSSVTIGRNGSTTQSAYYRAGSTPTFTFKGTLKENSQNVSMEITSDELTTDAFQAGQHCKLTLSLKPATAGAIITVEKVEVETVTISETIPVEWLPAPKINATGFDENKSLTIYETGDAASASIDFTVSQPLQDLSFTLNFADENLSALNKTYQLSTMTDEEKIALSDAGITLPLIGSNDPKITFPDTFISKLQSQNNSVVNNTITINSVTANNRSNTDGAQTYTIAVHKPEFSVSVLPNNVWSKEFTAEEITVEEGKGNAETIKQDLVYQYLENGEWKNFNDNRRQYFASHPNIKSYTVRAIYRNEIESMSISNVTLETPMQVSNSKMEDWYTTEDDTGWLGYTYYHFFPCSQGNEDVWWATNNDRSQDGTKAGRLSYRGCFSPCVSYSENVKYEGNRSALIYTSGHAGGYASTSSIIYPEGAIAGHLFIGQYSWKDKVETVTPGHNFVVRPTHMKFYYKYIPKDTDEFKAYIELKNGNETIASGEFIPSPIYAETNWEEATIELNYVTQPKVATSIFIQFLSTTKTSFSENDFNKNASISFPNMNDWVAHIGSKLYIDDISLIYDK